MSDSILIVEDEIKLANLLADYLQLTEYSPHLIHHGDEVIVWVKVNQPKPFYSTLCCPVKTGSICAKKSDDFLMYPT
jgi:two-component system response regulator BaeR